MSQCALFRFYEYGCWAYYECVQYVYARLTAIFDEYRNENRIRNMLLFFFLENKPRPIGNDDETRRHTRLEPSAGRRMTRFIPPDNVITLKHESPPRSKDFPTVYRPGRPDRSHSESFPRRVHYSHYVTMRRTALSHSNVKIQNTNW